MELKVKRELVSTDYVVLLSKLGFIVEASTEWVVAYRDNEKQKGRSGI